jgi:hypothetical protein
MSGVPLYLPLDAFNASRITFVLTEHRANSDRVSKQLCAAGYMV